MAQVPKPLHEDDQDHDQAGAISIAPATWRTEVTGRGRYFNWRTGRNENRKGKYGGLFGLLSEERQREYERNKRKRARRR